MLIFLQRKMGIKGLSKLIAEVAPKAIKKNGMKDYFGFEVAIDASMSLYQFLIQIRSYSAPLTNFHGKSRIDIADFCKIYREMV